MTLPFNVDFSIVLVSPFILAGMDSSGVGIDTPALRDETGAAVLPGDQLKGLMREALKKLEAAGSPLFDVPGGPKLTVESLFGKVSGPGATNRGHLRIRDLRADLPEGDARDITRIEIDDDTGAVKTGALQVIELVAPLNQQVTFSGAALFYGSQDEATALETLLRVGLRMIDGFGGARTSGFGEHASEQSTVNITPRPSVLRANVASRWPAGAQRATIEGTFSSAFMANVSRSADNVYVGGTVIPGGAIKGALADMLLCAGYRPDDMSQSFGQAFSALHISHAFPLVKGLKADLPLPFSIMRAAGDDNDFRCALGSNNPGLMDSNCADFQPDWKPPYDYAARAKACRPNSNIPQLMRGHTAINKRGVAEDQKLFLEVLRARTDCDGNPVTYRFTVDTTAAEAIDPRAAQMFGAMLSHEIDALGKTHAVFTADTLTPAAATAVPATERWRLCLDTPAVLVDTDANGFASVSQALKAYFKTVLPDTILADHFVRRTLVGGYAAQRRGGKTYMPVSLFEPGSCFLLTAPPSAAQAVADALSKLLTSGLPVLEGAAGTPLLPITDWQQSPYLPSNGYGRISVDPTAFTAFDAPNGAAP